VGWCIGICWVGALAFVGLTNWNLVGWLIGIWWLGVPELWRVPSSSIGIWWDGVPVFKRMVRELVGFDPLHDYFLNFRVVLGK
jgi:hypothetical protein